MYSSRYNNFHPQAATGTTVSASTQMYPESHKVKSHKSQVTELEVCNFVNFSQNLYSIIHTRKQLAADVVQAVT